MTVPDFFYEPPTVVSPLPVLSQHTQAFGMEYYQTVGTKYYYKSDSHSGTGTSITYDYETKTWNDEGSQVPYHLNTTSTFASTTSLVNPAEIHGFGSQQNHNGTRYFSVSNPYYEAIEPQTITPTSVNPAWGGATYIWIQTVGTSEIYTLAFGGVATNNNHEIQVDTITNTWSDYGTNNPNTVTDNGSTVTLSSGATTFVVFNKPTSASWL